VTSIVQVPKGRPDPAGIGYPMIERQSILGGDISSSVAEWLARVAAPTPTFASPPPSQGEDAPEELFDALAKFKIWTAKVAMHLDRDWRDRLFGQLDSLLDAESWEADDAPPSISSYSTFLRMLLLLRPHRRPGIGATSDGQLIAMWTSGNDRLTIECLSNDLVRWHLSVIIDTEQERAAGRTPLPRLSAVLGPYGPDRWFADANQLHSA
jgi:hypothetical protein